MKRQDIKNKRAFEMSFAWLFAIIVGAFILILAIYGVTRIFDTGGDIESARTGKEIGLLLNPLETGFESGQVTLLTMPVETRIYNRCTTFGNFGKQIIKVAQKNFGDWNPTEIDVGFSNKYIFSGDFEEGKNFFIFSKPFEFPFKISDVIYLSSSEKKYCFVDAPERIEEELLGLSEENIFLENCPEESIKVCFGSFGGNSECNVTVSESLKSVEKNNQNVYYETDSLMYGAIFSEKEVYECQVKRLMQRTEELSLLYNNKQDIIAGQGCFPGVNLLSLMNAASNLNDSNDLINVKFSSEVISEENDLAGECRLW